MMLFHLSLRNNDCITSEYQSSLPWVPDLRRGPFLLVDIPMYRVSGKKRYSLLCLVFQSACVDFFETCHNCRLKNGKKDECKINAFVLLSNIDKAICVETYFSTKSFGQTRRLLIKKLGWDHRKSRLAPNNATISTWLKEFRNGRLFHRKQGSGRPRAARSVESIRQVERSV